MGGRGQNFFYPNLYYFFLGAHAKFGNPTTTLSGRTVMAVEEKRKRQAGAELCQAQFKFGLAKPAVGSPPPSQLCWINPELCICLPHIQLRYPSP